MPKIDLRRPYTRYPSTPEPGFPNRTEVWLPVLEIALHEPVGGRVIRALCLLDTGADLTYFGTQYADALGIDWRNAPRIGYKGIGSRNDGYAVDVRLIVAAALQGWPARIVFSPTMDNEPFPLLGGEGFFDHCDVTFRHKKREFRLKA